MRSRLKPLMLVALTVPLLAGAAQLSSRAVPNSDCYQPRDTIARNGSVDVTAQLQAFFDSVPDHSCIRFPHQAQYWAEGTLVLRNRVDLTLRGWSSRIFAKHPGQTPSRPKDRFRVQLLVEGGSDITIRNLTIDGPNTSCAFQAAHYGEAGLQLAGVSGAAIINVRIQESQGDAFWTTDWADPPGSGHVHHTTNISVTGGSATCIGRQAISISDGQNVTFTGLTAGYSSRDTIDIENEVAGTIIDSVTIQNSIFTAKAGTDFLLGSRGDFNVSHINLLNNVLTGTAALNVKIGDSDGIVDRFDFQFVGNRQLGQYHGGDGRLQAIGLEGLIVQGNTLPFAVPTSLFNNLVQSPGNTVCGATFVGNALTGGSTLWDPGQTPCGWVDGGGNTFS